MGETEHTSNEESFADLMEGVSRWDISKQHIPSELLLVGKNSFPVMVNEKGQVLIAASSYGEGRLLVVAHEYYLFQPGFTPFLVNAVSWLCPVLGAPIAIHPSLQSVGNLLKKHGVDTKVESEPSDPQGVYCTTAYQENLVEKLFQFLKGGGGLLMAGQACTWANKHGHDKVLSKFPGNQVTRVGGVYFTGIQGNRDNFKVSQKIPMIPLDVRYDEELKEDQKQLLKGISELDIRAGGIPSLLLVHGELAFPLGMDSSLGCFLAASRYGRGRVVVGGHENLILSHRMHPFVLNALHWLAGRKNGKIGLDSKMSALGPMLTKNKLEWTSTNVLSNDLSVFCSFVSLTHMDPQKVEEFVAEGGGLLMGRHAWLWSLQHPDLKCMLHLPENKFLATFGLGITDQTGQRNRFPVPKPEDTKYHIRTALSQLATYLYSEKGSMQDSWREKLIKDCSYLFQILNYDAPIYKSMKWHILQMIKWDGLPHVGRESPITKGSSQAVLLSLAIELVNSGIASSMLLDHPAFLPTTESPVTIEIQTENHHSWVSTGLYLPEGQTLEVTMPGKAVGANLKVLIGCHTDNLSYAKTYHRPPLVTKTYTLDKPKKSFSWLWGGLIYILVPSNYKLGSIPITIRGASWAPSFKLGKTSKEEWKHLRLQNPAPWGELSTENIILTVPTTSLQTLEDPEPVLQLWDEMMQAASGLAAKPFPYRRPERIVFDVQVLGGLLHAGYPIVGRIEIVGDFISDAAIRKNGLWSGLHELGHNHQQSPWNFPPHTTEATCNLWAVYIHETVLDIPRARAHPELKPETRKKRIKNYVDKGAPLREWTMWIALETYLQLQEAFGWEPFTKIFADYQANSKGPKDNTKKMNLWVKKFSEAVNKNLVPFFETWGWPVEKEVSDSLASLPEWEENPMKMYVSCSGHHFIKNVHPFKYHHRSIGQKGNNREYNILFRNAKEKKERHPKEMSARGQLLSSLPRAMGAASLDQPQEGGRAPLPAATLQLWNETASPYLGICNEVEFEIHVPLEVF
ncbi:TRPM8 channel-associated factor 3-like [Perognathus longimembris pacificus]|uniref:TRPM8 channel-associated factor 3-like n=1 Tax=Perognathus longimembris pacificus TaxID=214514 RepID=UPI00201A1F3C|nr:TRPM8 channel-associated factor 3-like [Perognathus longimembris pacificus]